MVGLVRFGIDLEPLVVPGLRIHQGAIDKDVPGATRGHSRRDLARCGSGVRHGSRGERPGKYREEGQRRQGREDTTEDGATHGATSFCATRGALSHDTTP